MYQNLNIVKDINKKRIIWEGHNGRKEGLLLRTMIERVPQGKRPLGHLRLRWEDRVKEDVKVVRRGLKGIIVRKRKLEANFLDGMVLKAENHEEEKEEEEIPTEKFLFFVQKNSF
uniref:Uncharacterized protein n=1 Tax=Sipha flava TaxID=143950 RepID=A0A2S2RA64_9HEMI